ncbi:MAG: hypothetical protein IJ519_04775 [Clostridia bacterium]|nr:hypothetical protein [Clostridia bacterium]
MNNDNYNDIDYEEFRVKERGPVFKVVKWITLTLVGILCVLLVMRIFVNNNVPEEAKRLLWDEAGYSAYTLDPEGFEIVSHPLDSYVIKETGEQVVRNNMTADAYFSFSDVCYAPKADQLQLTLRYNVSTLEHVKKDLELEELREGEPFIYRLVDDEERVYGEYAYTAAQKDFLGKPRYEYRRLLFSGVDVSEVKTLTLQVYYADMPDAEKPVGEIMIYDKEYENAEGARSLDFDAPDGVSDGIVK